MPAYDTMLFEIRTTDRRTQVKVIVVSSRELRVRQGLVAYCSSSDLIIRHYRRADMPRAFSCVRMPLRNPAEKPRHTGHLKSAAAQNTDFFRGERPIEYGDLVQAAFPVRLVVAASTKEQTVEPRGKPRRGFGFDFGLRIPV